MKLDQSYITKIKNYFQDKPVIRAYLFGSFVRDEGSEQSDIDILVELDYSQPIGLKFVGMALDLEDLLQRKVDLVSANGVSKYIKPYIDQDKILIYVR